MTNNIVILGSSFVGLSAIHNVLRNILPRLKSSSPTQDYKVIIVNPSTQLYWVPASPRALVTDKLIPTEKLFSPIEEALAEYPKSAWEFIHGKASSVNFEGHKVDILVTSSGQKTTVDYHALIISSGSSSVSPFWHVADGHEKTASAIKAMHIALPKAQSIVVAGGGPAGVETAGELGSEFGHKKDITLFSGSEHLLTGIPSAAQGQKAEKFLKNLGINVVHQLQVKATEPTEKGQTKLTLSDGSTRVVDVYIDATGLKPNTSYLPASVLDKRGAVITDEKMRVRGAGPRVYAAGSCASHSNGGIVDVMNSIPILVSNIEYDLSDGKSGQEKTYTPSDKIVQLVPVGTSKGVGVLFNWAVPSLMVWLIKGRNFMIDGMKEWRDGAKLAKKA